MSDLTTEELAAITYWPFPPPDGYIYDHEALKHWVHDVLQFQPPSDLSNGGAGRVEDPGVEKSRFVALATASLISGVLDDQRFAERLGDDVPEKTASSNSARVATFVDGLIASPPIVELIPLPSSGTIVVVIPIPLPVPPPVPPEWDPDEQLTGRDLVAAGIRLHAAGRQVTDGSLQDQLLSAAERLIEVGQSRFATVPA